MIAEEKIYAGIIDNLFDGFALHKIVCDEKGNPIDCIWEDVNHTYEKHVGRKKEELIGKSLLSIFPKTEKYWLETFGKVALTGESSEIENYSIEFDKYLHLKVYSPQKEYFAVLAKDISEKKELEKRLILEKEMAEESSRLKSEFLSNMTHELRTPLNGILGFADYLSEIERDDTKKDILNVIESSGQNLLTLINDMLDLSKIEAGKMRLNNEKFNILELFDEIETIYDKMTKSRESKFYIKKNIRTNIIIGDSLRIKQILMNLIGNAIKFTNRGEISLEITERIVNEKKSEYIFTIKDNGIGINSEKMEKLFEAFEQGEVSISKKYGGTGLGLSIVKKMVDLMNGEIFVESEIGKGTTFEVKIPFETEREHIYKKKIDKKIIYDFSNFNILIAEDDAVSLRLIRMIAESTGIKYNVASDGKEVLNKVEKNNFDLVLMDLQMPNMSGLDATKIIRDKKSNIPIIATSAYAFDKDIERAFACGVNDYMPKPYSNNRVMEMLEKWLYR